MLNWVVWSANQEVVHNSWPSEGIDIVGLAVQIGSGQWFWFESEYYGFIDGLPEGRESPADLVNIRLGVQVSDTEMERVRAQASRKTGLKLL